MFPINHSNSVVGGLLELFLLTIMQKPMNSYEISTYTNIY